MDKKVLALSKSYTDESLIGGGAIKGKNATVSSIVNADGTHAVTFEWTLDDGTKKNQSFVVKDGVDGKSAYELAVELGYTGTLDEWIASLKGEQGDKGDTGVGIELITKTGSTGIVDNYEILFTDGTVTTYTVVNGANITKLSELENDEEFIKANTINLTNYYLKNEIYNKSQIDDLLRNVGAGLSVKIVAVLPEGEAISGTTIYLINASGSNYNQFMYIDGSWANLGSTEVDMSSYYNKTQIDTKLEDYVTSNRLTNKLDDYVQKDKLSKVGKTNSYNDLDDLPTIPDVSGLKPYAETLQDSTNTAPVSKVVYDAVQTINEALDEKLEESDLEPYAKSEVVGDLADLKTTNKSNVVGAINEVNVNLGEKADKADLAKYDTKGNQSITLKTDANLCIPEENTESINYVHYGSANLPTKNSSCFIRTQRSTSYIVQFASDVQNELTKTEPDYTRKAKLIDGTWIFSPWTEIATMDKVGYVRRFDSVPDNDWNNAIEEGSYNIPFDSAANQIANRPADYAVQVIVTRADTNDLNFVYQTAYTCLNSIRVRMQKSDGTWTAWKNLVDF